MKRLYELWVLNIYAKPCFSDRRLVVTVLPDLASDAKTGVACTSPCRYEGVDWLGGWSEAGRARKAEGSR